MESRVFAALARTVDDITRNVRRRAEAPAQRMASRCGDAPVSGASKRYRRPPRRPADARKAR
jgi:hypothetical protein